MNIGFCKGPHHTIHIIQYKLLIVTTYCVHIILSTYFCLFCQIIVSLKEQMKANSLSESEAIVMVSDGVINQWR